YVACSCMEISFALLYSSLPRSTLFPYTTLFRSYVWRILFQLGRHLAIPSAGPSADVGHPKLKALDLGAKVLGGSCANGRAVHVSEDGFDGRQFSEAVEDVRRSDVAGMEDEVHARQILVERRMVVAVRVGEDAESHAEIIDPSAPYSVRSANRNGRYSLCRSAAVTAFRSRPRRVASRRPTSALSRLPASMSRPGPKA